MNITWLGHSCFLLEEDGCRIVTDPYTGVDGYPELRVEAHGVYCSHSHFDHCATDRVKTLSPVRNPFTVREIQTFHDDKHGLLRGKNTVRVFTAGGVSVAHMGDLGHQLSPRQLREIGPLDAVLIPVGGTYTVDAKAAKAVCDALKARCVIPMHYRFGKYGLSNIGTVDAFLTLWPPEAVHRLDSASFDLTPDLSGVIVPKFP